MTFVNLENWPSNLVIKVTAPRPVNVPTAAVTGWPPGWTNFPYSGTIIRAGGVYGYLLLTAYSNGNLAIGGGSEGGGDFSLQINDTIELHPTKSLFTGLQAASVINTAAISAVDSSTLHRAGAENVAGQKTFSDPAHFPGGILLHGGKISGGSAPGAGGFFPDLKGDAYLDSTGAIYLRPGVPKDASSVPPALVTLYQNATVAIAGRFDVAATSTDGTTVVHMGELTFVYNPSTDGGQGSAASFTATVPSSNTATIAEVDGIDVTTNYYGSGVMTEFCTVNTFMGHFGSGRIGWYYCYYANYMIESSGNIDNAALFYGVPPPAHAGAGKVTNNYGIYLQDHSTAGLNNWACLSQGGTWEIRTGTDGTVGVVVRASNATQSADLIQIRDHTGLKRVYVDASFTLHGDGSGLTGVTAAAVGSGSTAARPATTAVGSTWYDTSLGVPVWFDGKNWRNAAGTIV